MHHFPAAIFSSTESTVWLWFHKFPIGLQLNIVATTLLSLCLPAFKETTLKYSAFHDWDSFTFAETELDFENMWPFPKYVISLGCCLASSAYSEHGCIGRDMPHRR